MSDISKFQTPDGTIYDLKDGSARNQIDDLQPIGNASGNPIVIDDGADDVPVKSLKVTLEPQQDLNGYDNPWISTEVDKTPYNFRASSDSIVSDLGTHELDTIVGGSIVWNQIVKNGDFSDGTDNWVVSVSTGVSMSASNNVLTVVKTAGSSGGVLQRGNAIPNHVYLCFASGKIVSGNYYNIRLVDKLGSIAITIDSEEWQTGALIAKAPASDSDSIVYIRYPGVTTGTANVKDIAIFDLTQMFGSTIADYIYSLEQANAGAGVAWFKKLFPNDYYEYNAGEIVSVEGLSAHKTTGFNQWDEEWEVGTIVNGADVASNSVIRGKNYISVVPGATYYGKISAGSLILWFYDSNKTYMSNGFIGNATFTIPANIRYMRISTNSVYGATYNHDICINISDPAKNGTYEPYKGHSYPLDSTKTFRGIFKLDSDNKLYADGDVYRADGSVMHKYAVKVLDGSEAWQTNTAADGLFYVDHVALVGIKGSGDIFSDKFIKTTVAGSAMVNGEMKIVSTNVNFKTSYATVDAWKTALASNPVTLLYELATTTTETADPYTSAQVIDSDGTEEYISTSIVPVGHESRYANICPISGWTGCKVTRIGKNLLNLNDYIKRSGNTKPDVTVSGDTVTVADGTTSGRYVSFVVRVVVGEKYTVVADESTLTFGGIWFEETKPDSYGRAGNTTDWTTAITVTATAPWMVIMLQGASGTIKGLRCNAGESAEPYEPFGNTYDITFPDSAGTVYGGSLDVVNGVLTVDMAMVDLGTLTWYNNANCFYSPSLNRKNSNSNDAVYYCSQYQYAGISSSNNAAYNKGNLKCSVYNGSDARVYIRDDAYNDAGIFKTAMSGVQLVYELATPITIQLTPTEITTLLGYNYIASDGMVELEYCKSNASNEIYLHKSSLSSSAIVSPDEGDNQFSVAYNQNKKLSVNIPQDTYVKTVNDVDPDDGNVVLTAADVPADGVTEQNAQGNLIVITDGVDSMPVKSMTVAVEAVQSGSGDPSPTNICPISGWTGCKIPVTGKNLLPETSFSGTYYKDVLVRLKAGTYTLSGNCDSESTSANMMVRFFYSDNSYVPHFITKGTGNSADITLEKDVYYIRFYASSSATDSRERAFSFTNMQLEIGSTATDYEPYEGNTYDITFPDSAGTVYGGTLDVVNGTLTVDMQSVTLDGNTTISSHTEGSSTARPSFTFSNILPYGTFNVSKQDILANWVRRETSESSSSRRNVDYWSIRGANTTGYKHLYLYAPYGAEVTEAQLTQMLTDNPLQVVINIRTPLTFTLDPTTIRTLLGLNNIWADCGNITLKYYGYYESTVQDEVDEFEQKMIGVQRSFAFDEDTVASREHPVGDYLIYLNRLYKATAAISSGDTLVIGTNIEPTSLATELALLNAKIDSILQSVTG